MAKSRSIEDTLDRLAALRLAPSAPETRAELAKGLASPVNHVAAKAAALCAELGRTDLGPALVAAFNRFHGGYADKQYVAHTAIARALFDTKADAPGVQEVFIAGAHIRGGGWGMLPDPAAELRAICALGLVQSRHRDAMTELVDMLVDPAATARVGAARALAGTGREEAALLLRLKLATGDLEPEVLGECMTGLLRLAPREALPLVKRRLADENDQLRSAAALALGESRRPEALEPLVGALDVEKDNHVRGTLLLSMAMLRTPESRDALIRIVRHGPTYDAADALSALAIYRHDTTIRPLVEQAVADRNDDKVRRALPQAFGRV